MYLRPHSRSKDGKSHAYWSLVETVRTPDGPRQKEDDRSREDERDQPGKDHQNPFHGVRPFSSFAQRRMTRYPH